MTTPHPHGSVEYKKDSITLFGAVAMGTGVMIGAGIFALTGQVAELAGPYFPLSFALGALVTGFSAYSYIKMSNAWPSSGGIAMILQKCYGSGAVAAGAALLMALSMVIAESLVARTFATYFLRAFDVADGPLVPVLAVSVIGFAFWVNVSGNRSIGLFSKGMAIFKVGGIAAFGIAALWSSGIDFTPAIVGGGESRPYGFVASVALTILAFKGFTTITNSGSEITRPKRNVGRAIMLSILVCVLLYLLVAIGVRSSLSLEQIVSARDYALAEAAEPTMGRLGFILTIVLAVVATASAVLASVFAVSRMLAMLTDMDMIPHRHFGMPGSVQKHTLVYTVVLASVLAIFFDLGQIASLGAFFYLVMDITVHFGVWRYRRREIGASGLILLLALGFDLIVLVAFTVFKLQQDWAIVLIAGAVIGVVFGLERLYLSNWIKQNERGDEAL
jgi:amino acid transporter